MARSDERHDDPHDDDELAPLVGSDNVTGPDTAPQDDAVPARPHGDDVRAPVDAGPVAPDTEHP